MGKRKVVISKHGDHVILKDGSKSIDVGTITKWVSGVYTAKIKGDVDGDEYYEIEEERIDKHCIKLHYKFIGDNWCEISAPTMKVLKEIADKKYGWTTGDVQH